MVGADKWRNPDEDLPADFEAAGSSTTRALRKPLDAERVHRRSSGTRCAPSWPPCDDALPRWRGWTISDRASRGRSSCTGFDAAPEPRNLRRLKNDVRTRWGTVPLIDMLKEAVLRTGCLTGGHLGRPAAADLPPRCSPSGCCWPSTPTAPTPGSARSPAADHGHGEDDMRYVRRRYLTAEVARAIAIEIANATFAARAHDRVGRRVDRRGHRLHPLRRVRPEHLHRVALPLRRPRRADLLARRAQVAWRSTPS